MKSCSAGIIYAEQRPTSMTPLSEEGMEIRWPSISTVAERTKEPSEFPRSSFLLITVNDGREGSRPGEGIYVNVSSVTIDLKASEPEVIKC